MGKRPQRHTWGEAKRLCRLNQNDINMAKNLGFGPDGLIRSRPDPKQKWKLPVKDWIRELHSERFGCVLAEKPEPAPGLTTPVDDEEAARRYEEELYWEDYWERNRDYQPAKTPTRQARPASSAPGTVTRDDSWIDEIMDEDVPF